MRLFTLPSGALDAKQRTAWLLPEFDLAVVDEVVIGPPICVCVANRMRWAIGLVARQRVAVELIRAARWRVEFAAEQLHEVQPASHQRWVVESQNTGCGSCR